MKTNTNFLRTVVGGTLISFLTVCGANASNNPTNNDPITKTEKTTEVKAEAEGFSKYMSDYNSVEEVLQDFSFWGAIDVESIELKEFDAPGGSSAPASRKKQLKFTIKDRRIPSGFTFKPNKALVGKEMRIEMRLVPSEADHEVRFGEGRNNRDVTAGWRMIFEDTQEGREYNAKDFSDYQMQGLYPGFSTLAGADITFEPKGFVNDWYFYCTRDNDLMKPNYPVPGGKRPMRDVISRHAKKINPNCDYSENPERAIVKQVDVLIGGSTYKLWEDANKFSGYDRETGFPNDKADYDKVMNFQGDIYITYIEWGDKEVN